VNDKYAEFAIPADLMREIPAIGMRWDGESLLVGLPDVFDDQEEAAALQKLAAVDLKNVGVIRVPDRELRELVEYTLEAASVRSEAQIAEIAEGDEGPIADLVNQILNRAVRLRASDVHIEPAENEVIVRIRVDGALEELTRQPATVAAPIVSRLKVLGKMNIVERRRPQDGQFSTVAAGREIDVRMATVATLFGEKAVLRLLDTKRASVDMSDLGMNETALAHFQHMLAATYGMIVAAGPTGAGKTTTLQCALRDINTPERNVSTLEDPVEYVVPGINHIPVNESIGAGFAQQLRAILRQDPDVVLIGEVRDAETARIGIHAALSGRLVLTSLHAPDAIGVIYRLYQMEVEPHLVAASLRGAVSQRLLRRVCSYCVQYRDASYAERRILGDAAVGHSEIRLARGVGCSMCRGTGYRDRIGAFQVFEISDDLRELISMRPEPGKLYDMARRDGLVSIADQAYELARSGLTTLEEVARMVGTDA
jgi:type IV pilus assembly protein PilB